MKYPRRQKEICTRCNCKAYVSPIFDKLKVGHCMYIYAFDQPKYEDELPSCCNYKLEQLVITQKKYNEKN